MRELLLFVDRHFFLGLLLFVFRLRLVFLLELFRLEGRLLVLVERSAWSYEHCIDHDLLAGTQNYEHHSQYR